MANAKQTNRNTVGRFEYVEPMNMELNQADNGMINNPEDFCISVNLEVSLPSRFYEDTPTILNASSDNGTISFFGGVNTSDDGKDNGQGFLSTSWTDVSVHNTDKGNRDSIGIESINISYSPTFFPVVTIRFVDVRGASLFMPQEKAYENYTESGDFASGKMFQSSSFFKSLFSMPSPIFKLTVKGFYGQSVSYNLMMSKSNFEFDSENGNFIANVEFAGQMYGIYTDLPMSFVALAPYIDNKKYWDEKVNDGTFVFDNQTGMKTIPELIKAIASATTQSKMESMQSPTGKELNKVESEIELLKKIKEEFPIREFNNNDLKKVHKLETRGKAGRGIGESISVENNKLKVDENRIKEKKQNLPKYGTEKNTYYIIRSTPYIDLSKNKVNSNSIFVGENIVGDSSQFFAVFDAEEYKKSLNELVSYGEEFKKYKEDFDYLLEELDYGDKYFEVGKATKACLPAFAFIQSDGKSEIIRGIDSVDFGYTLDFTKKQIVLLSQQKVNGKVFKNVYSGETHMVFYNDFYLHEKDIDRLRNCDKNFFNEIHGNEINLTGKVNNTTCVVWRIATNIFDYIEEDLKRLEKKKKELTNEIVEVQQEKTKALLGFDLNIENIYNLIFAHIDTFMHKYYDVLKETSINDGRNKLLCNYKQNICDVPSKVLEQGKVPPYPAIVEEKDKKKILVWPTKILQEEIAETNFVNRIIAASLQLSDDLEKAREVMAEYAKSSVKSMEYGVDKLIPTNIVDFFIDEVKTNPYEECVNSFKKDGGNVNKIWFVFAMRCLYFVLMFRKYRTETPLNKDISNICNMFAINEVTNIRKAFGDDMTRQLLTDITNKKKSEFFKFLVNEISSTIEDNNYNLAYGNNYYLTKFNFLQNFNSTTILNGYKYKITIDEENYSVIPVRNINKEKLQTDIENGNCLNNKDYIIIKNNGDIIEDRLFNEKTIKVYENIPKLFGNYISLIQGDETYKDVSNGYSEKNSEVLEDMLKNYLGSNIIENNAIQKEGSSFLSPYNIDGNTKIFSTNNEDNEYQSYEYQDVKGYFENVWLETKFNNKKVKYTSFIGNRKCIDTVNVLINGLPGNDTKKQQEHFASTLPTTQQNVNVDKIRFIGSNATDYDIAYIFLFTLPIDFRYTHIATFSNVKNIAKTVLLREGAFYYWQEHYVGMIERLKANHFNTDKMNENSIPIVKNDETLMSNAPTFYPSVKNDDYLTWDFIVERDKLKEGHARISASRRKFLKEYFEKWVETEFSNGIKNSNGPTNSISNLYTDEILYIDYSEVLNRDVYDGMYYNVSIKDSPKTFFDKTYDTFIECMKNAYPENYINTSPISILENTSTIVTSNEDIKLSIYLTLQTLYNKFIAGNPLTRWTYGHKDSDFKRFLYLDSYYKKIGDRLILNGTNISHLLADVSTTINALTHSEEGVYRESVYEFLSRICEKNGLNLIALPINPFVFTTKESPDYGEPILGEPILWDLFDTIPYSKMNTGDTSCFISLYTYRPSEHLDMQDDSGLYGYENDGFDINKNGEKDLPLPLQSFGDSSSIPAFAVSYAKQNQSIFKRINVGTTNPQTTEASLAMTFNIVSKGDSAPRDTVLYGQDIYSEYSNYSYTCDVEMMGCAPISPMMYFQLNNIPMFKGAYMIYSVEHNITAGNMTTKFKGNRVSKNAIPFAQPDVIYLDENGKPHDYDNGGSSNNDSVNNQKNTGSSDYTPSLDENNKMRMAQAFDWCFECSTPVPGKCSRYTFRMAYGYKKGKKDCPNAGGNANERGYWDNLKRIGYTEQLSRYFETSKELVSFLNDINFDYGDVIVYYATKFKLDNYNSNDKTEYVYQVNTNNLRIVNKNNKYGIPSPVAYGHTQIYTGDAKISETGGSKWASSVKDNYDAGNFIYGTQTKDYNLRGWNLIIFRANQN